MLDFPIGQFLLYCAFVIAKSPRATARGLFFDDGTMDVRFPAAR